MQQTKEPKRRSTNALPEQRKDTKVALSIFDKQPYAGIVILHGDDPTKITAWRTIINPRRLRGR